MVDRAEEILTQKTQQKKRYKRYRTEESRKQRDIENHPLLPASSSTCSKQCSKNFAEQVRTRINKYYWNMPSKEMQMQWMLQIIETCTPFCPRKHTSGKKERKVTRIFFLEKEGRKKIHIRQVMFLRTLSFKSNRIMITKTADTRNDVFNDNRGRQDPANKKSQKMAERVVSHIKKYDPSISHYRQAHAKNRLYVLPEHSVSSMHKDFIAWYPDDRISYSYCQNKVKSFNISFVKLGEEECEICKLHITHLKVEHMLSEIEHTQSTDGRSTDGSPNCSKCESFKEYRNSNRSPIFLSKRES